jgi:hypothetical protein
VRGVRVGERLGGGHVDHDDPGQVVPAAELAQVGGDPLGRPGLGPGGGQRPQVGLDRGQLVGQGGDQPAGHHAGGGQRVGLLQHRSGDDVVATEDQLAPAGQGRAAQLRQFGDAAGGFDQAGPQGGGADHGGDGDGAARTDQPDSRAHDSTPNTMCHLCYVKRR